VERILGRKDLVQDADEGGTEERQRRENADDLNKE
jgi:hypothetical protein